MNRCLLGHKWYRSFAIYPDEFCATCGKRRERDAAVADFKKKAAALLTRAACLLCCWYVAGALLAALLAIPVSIVLGLIYWEITNGG